ncbi:tRNAHis guanylyltransferase [Panus rudis PR-1116 ss-1]|nr:tRNAHis guanylyltransferase [Panus rudis PR-1116 ss-1]
MAGSKYAYVKKYELPDALLPGTFIVARIDGHAFHRLSQEHGFTKPNDERALQLMDHAARDVMSEFKDIVLAFGESDEYSFLFRKSSTVFNRRCAKILSTLTSRFTSSYVFNWSTYFLDTTLHYPPTFDGRLVLYPSSREVRDYFAWRQVDTHINNLYNTTFWALVQQSRKTPAEAHAALKGTVAKQKHEILFSNYNINYNNLPARFRKGSILVREFVQSDDHQDSQQQDATQLQATQRDQMVEQGGSSRSSRAKKVEPRTEVALLHCDLIGDEFWALRPHLLSD